MTAPSRPSGPLPVAFIGDSHLVAGDETTDALAAFIDGSVGRFSRLVLVGDIFDLWLARPHLQEPHHEIILAAVARARARGVEVDYVVGNRDFGLERATSLPFTRVESEVLAETTEDLPAWLAEHGDLVNDDDRQYRAWRRFARSRVVLGAFLALPAVIGVPLSQWLERRMRTSNLAYKRRFPAEHAERHAAKHFERTGARMLVLGHFHQELRIGAPGGEILVLPDWKHARRHAEWHAEPAPFGRIEMRDSTP